MDIDEWVLVARLVRPQGRRGEVVADILTDFPEKFAERPRLFLLDPDRAPSPRQLHVENFWPHQGRMVFKFEGIDSIEAAEALRDAALALPRSERASLEQDAVYISDLVGCKVFDQTTQQWIGSIVDVDRESTSTALLVVQSESSREILVPFVKAFLGSIDLPAKEIRMTLPQGLLDLDRKDGP